MEISLKQIALDYIQNYNGWVNKGELCMLAQQQGYSPENICRRCRELVNEGRIEVSYYKGKKGQKLARYAKIGEAKPITKPLITFKEINGERIAIMQ